jgi:hypothetical protein
MSTVTFAFRLNEEFVASYKDKTAPFGYRDAGGNSVGEITFLRTYSRKKEDGTRSRRNTARLIVFHGQMLRLRLQQRKHTTVYST